MTRGTEPLRSPAVCAAPGRLDAREGPHATTSQLAFASAPLSPDMGGTPLSPSRTAGLCLKAPVIRREAEELTRGFQLTPSSAASCVHGLQRTPWPGWGAVSSRSMQNENSKYEQFLVNSLGPIELSLGAFRTTPDARPLRNRPL